MTKEEAFEVKQLMENCFNHGQFTTTKHDVFARECAYELGCLNNLIDTQKLTESVS